MMKANLTREPLVPSEEERVDLQRLHALMDQGLLLIGETRAGLREVTADIVQANEELNENLSTIH